MSDNIINSNDIYKAHRMIQTITRSKVRQEKKIYFYASFVLKKNTNFVLFFEIFETRCLFLNRFSTSDNVCTYIPTYKEVKIRS